MKSTRVVCGSQSIVACQASAIVVTIFDSDDELSGTVVALDEAAEQYFSRLRKAGQLPSKVAEVSKFYQVPGLASSCVVVVGCGLEAEFTAAVAQRCAGAAAKTLAARQLDSVAFDFGQIDETVAVAAISAALNGCVGQDLFRKEKKLYPFDRLEWFSLAEPVVRRGFVVGQAVLVARELVNLPPNLLYPTSFTQRAAEIAVSSGLELEVWDELRLRRERCDALLAVAAGSSRPPRLLILRYAGRASGPPLALVGKGVTFDSGGLSLKPSEGMVTMKCDMAGAATVVAAMQAIAELKVATPVVGLVGMVENMVNGNSFKLGDVITARNGKTIEVLNTDAEGRMVLADVLNVALDETPRGIVDVATLTGACLVALGTDIAGLMSNDKAWEERVQVAAEVAGELVWPLPMHPHFGEQIQSSVADIKNIGEGRWAGAVTAAKFLQEFVGDKPWTHIDIAGPAFASSPKPYIDAGASGAIVRTLVAMAQSL